MHANGQHLTPHAAWRKAPYTCRAADLSAAVQKFYFASLLMVFGIEITCDWLFFSYSKVRLQDMLLLIFACPVHACMGISMLHASPDLRVLTDVQHPQASANLLCSSMLHKHFGMNTRGWRLAHISHTMTHTP